MFLILFQKHPQLLAQRVGKIVRKLAQPFSLPLLSRNLMRRKGLTFRRSRPPTAAAELRALACSKPALFRPMLYSPAFTFSSVYPLVFLPCAGLRLGVLRQFQAFLASTACAACASSYHFSGIAPLPWRRAFSQFAPVVKLGFPVLASGSNCAVKPTRLRRSAYLAR